MSILKLEGVNEADFMARFGGLYEHSPWIAQSAWQQLCSQSTDVDSVSVELLQKHLRTAVDTASKEQQLTLLKAHPELAGKAAIDGKLTSESTEEQASARLDMCTKAEFDRFQALNTQYNEKFGFPFILAVRGRSRAEILLAFESRINNAVQKEFDTALEQVHQIAALRLNALNSD